MKTYLAILAVLFCASALLADAADDAAAEALARKSGCLKCHSVARKEDGPSFGETAAEYGPSPSPM